LLREVRGTARGVGGCIVAQQQHVGVYCGW
jgi:hypothetical protein